MANLIVCCDGTWNDRENKDGKIPAPTNVMKFHASLAAEGKQGTKQKSYYGDGVGTSGGKIRRLVDGALGLGLEDDIKSAYKWLAQTYQDGDQIFLIGFSRGAYTARSLAGMIGAVGLYDLTGNTMSEAEKWQEVHNALVMYRNHKAEKPLLREYFGMRSFEMKAPSRAPDDVRIKFLGVWDTVGSLGIPDDLGLLQLLLGDPRNRRFHDTELGSIVDYARHALAIDERRIDFAPTLWTSQSDEHDDPRLEQVWFTGVHGDVGGSYADHDLGDLSLEWMMQQAEKRGLKFRVGTHSQLANVPQGLLHDSVTGVFRKRQTRPRCVPSFTKAKDDLSRISESALKRHNSPRLSEPDYWRSIQLDPNQEETVSIHAGERWAQTGIFVEEGQCYELLGAGEWLDASIKAGPEGAYAGFHLGKVFGYGLAAIPGAARSLTRKIQRTKNADSIWARRVPEHHWFALIGVVANGKGVSEGSKSLNRHEQFLVGKKHVLKPKGDGFLYCFPNDAWAMYGNNAGSLKLTVRRLS